MPPQLYFYANFATIRLNKNRSHAKSYDRPALRDIEWDLFYALLEAKGFSGFAEDPLYSCDYTLLENLPTSYLQEFHPHLVYNSTPKKFIPPRDYIKQQHSQHFATPLYNNEASNFMMMGARNTGKSYIIGAGVIAHTFLFDGRTNISAKPAPVELLVGSVVSDKSADILKKAKECMDLLPGAYSNSAVTFPAPFSKRYVGSFAVNSEIIAGVRKKNNIIGSLSSIKHRSFNENSFAAQGTRPSYLILEECGLIPNLEEIYSNTVENLRDGLRKTSSLVFLGTGGDMEKGSIPSSKMFFEPEKYDILKFPNIYEDSNHPIGYFIPAYMSLNEFKNSEGNTDVEAAKKALLKEREKLKSGSSDALYKMIQYKPLVPTEMFLTSQANIFPATELRRRLTQLINNPIIPLEVELYHDPESPYNKVNYKLNPNAQPITTYPFSGDSREGSITIYELPNLFQNGTPPDAYVIGHDTIKEDTPNGPSLAVIYVMKTSAYFSTHGHHEIVASYIGRPYEGKNAVNEILHKLSLFYGQAKIYFEAQVGNVKDYFERIQRLDLLASQPTTLFQRKASYNAPATLTYGYPMSNEKIKWEAIQYLRNFLLEKHDEDHLNLDLIPDPGLLQELIAFSMRGNFDRVMGLVGCIVGLQEIHNLSTKRLNAEQSTKQLFNQFDKINKKLFPNANETTDFFSR